MRQEHLQIPMIDLKRTHKPIESDLQSAFNRVLGNNSYILGKEVEALEKKCADYLNVKYAIGTSSGSDSLLLALMALDIKPGDEVICPTYTFFATAGAISRLGAIPVFVDIDPQSYNLSLKGVKKAITKKTKAIIPVHLFGQCADMTPLLELGKKKKIAIIEDAAQAFGAKSPGEMAGSMGDFGCFSFFPSKNLGGFGDGGLLTTQDPELYERAKILRAHGAKPKYYHHLIGGNFRLDALQAALLAVKLPMVNNYAFKRQQIAKAYTSHLLESDLATLKGQENGKPINLPVQVQEDSFHVWNQYVIQLTEADKRASLQEYLKQRGVATAIYYPLPLHWQTCFSDLGYKKGDLPVAELASQTTLALPIFPEMTEAECAYVAEHIQQFFYS